ncbi:MAG: hypothetical protein AAB426_04905 [Myxococcota bacterium]
MRRNSAHGHAAAVVLGVALVASQGACDPSSEEAFVHGRARDPCEQTIPACEGGLFASCELDDSRYTESHFPGAVRFLVRAEPLDRIEIGLYFADVRDSGLETTFYWYEPGCSEVYTERVEGSVLLDEAKDTGSVFRDRQVLEDGEHLVEVLSDAQSRVLVIVNVLEPNT